jgi:threonine/homoserine/homoserine lactone efflux protein
LVVWVIGLRECDLSEIALASGVISIIGYVAYLVWMVDTAPSGPKRIPANTSMFDPLMLTLLNAYATHDFMIQVITFNPNRKDYPKIVVILFIVTTLVFMFACFSA